MRFIVALGYLALLMPGPIALARDPLEEIIDRSFPVNSTASLTIKNTDGAIRIYAAKNPEIRMRAIKRAYSAERLRNIDVQVEATGDSVAIDTRFPPTTRKWSLADRSGTVDYTIVVPQTASISGLELLNGEIIVEGLRGGSAKANLLNGRITGHNCFGNLDFRVENGGIDFFYDWWEEGFFALNGRTNNASIKASLPPDACFTIDATTNGGTISNKFMKKTKDNGGSETAQKSFHAIVGNESGPRFTLESAHGSVRIEPSY